MPAPLSVRIARALFVAASCLLGIAVALGFDGPTWVGAIAGTAFGAFLVLIDTLIKNFSIRGFSSATFGLLIGLGCAWLVTRIGIFDTPYLRGLKNYDALRNVIELVVYMSLAFLGITLALRSDRDEFSLIIPYVRFRREATLDQPLLVDTNVIIDGRIPGICETGFLGGTLIVPQFVLDELQRLADSPDEIKRERGRRGLDCLDKLKETPRLEITIQKDDPDEVDSVDAKLAHLAKRIGAQLLTNDSNLTQVARLQGVPVLNFNELTKAMRPLVGPGDELELRLVKKGKDDHQAVGYLGDGTMIVVNNGAGSIGESVEVVIASALQTSAGRLIFAEIKKSGATARAKTEG